MLGYVCLFRLLGHYLLLMLTFDLLGCWEEPSLSPGVLNKTLSHIWLKLYLSNVLVQIWIVNSNVDWFLDGSCLPPVLLAYYTEAIVLHGMTCLLDVHMDRRGMFQIFFVSFPQVPGYLFYVLLIACYVCTFVTVDNSTFLLLWVLVFGFHKELFCCSVSIEMYLDAIFTTYIFEAFRCSFCVWDDYFVLCSFGCFLLYLLSLHLDCWLIVLGCCLHCHVPLSCYWELYFVP